MKTICITFIDRSTLEVEATVRFEEKYATVDCEQTTMRIPWTSILIIEEKK